MNAIYCSEITAASVAFYQSYLVGAGSWSCVLPVALAVAPDGSFWAAATDLWIEPHIMQRLINYPAQSRFFYEHRMFVNLQVVSEVCRDAVLVSRVQQIVSNCLWIPHPTAWFN